MQASRFMNKRNGAPAKNSESKVLAQSEVKQADNKAKGKALCKNKRNVKEISNDSSRNGRAEKQAFVYILLCADDTFYCGFTFDVEKRVQAHNDKKGAKYTRGRLPVKLVYKEKCENKSAALKREREIKKMTRTQKLLVIGSNI